ncbi:hypothetical protein SSX86_007710 [Deinandra increscens subsp. villosa]|uniref:PWWP domain-containing protein n=1 Tax=Deinandra increscens subsp. villosa TaxID=3103831 RepID=A0AAP0DF69_9ASTR
MMDGDVGGDSTNPSVESESVRDGSSSENRVDSASVHVIGDSTAVEVVESVVRSVAEGSIDSVSAEENVRDSNNEASSNRSHGSVKHVTSEQKKVQRRKDAKSKESTSPVYDSMISAFDEYAANGSAATEDRSPGHGFEVGDMVWGKVKSHPWWPGHIFSEKFATASVRRSKRDGLLLVAFFGDSSYGWFHPSELIPFDSSFADKSRQTTSKTFIKAVEEAMDEVSRRSALGLSCMCRSKNNFRQTDVQGYFAVDVSDYEPGAVYSIDAIQKARDSFHPSSALDFVRRLALEPTGMEHGVDFVKNKAKVVSYRRAVYEEFDETYAQAFGYDSVRQSSGSTQEPDPRKTPSKAPLSGRQVFADTSGKGKSSAKPNKPKDHAKKDKYLLKRREEPKEVKAHQKKERDKVTSPSQLGHIEEDVALPAGDYVLQKRVSATTHDELPSKDSGASVEDTPVVVDFGDPGIQTIKNKRVDGNDLDRITVSQMEDKKTTFDSVVDKAPSDKRAVTQNDILSSGPYKMSSSENADEGPKTVKVSKRPVGEMGSSEKKKKKRKKEQLISDGTGKVGPVDKEKVSAKKHLQSSVPSIQDPHGPDNNKSITSHTSGTKDATGLDNNETELSPVLGDLHLLALDPFHAINRGRLVKTRQVFLKFRSLVFQKSLNLSPPAEDDEGDGTTYSSKSSENRIGVAPVKSPSNSSVRPDDPTVGGRKRGPSDRQEEMAARKKKKVGEIRNLTKERKVIKKIVEQPTPTVKQPVVKTMKKPGPELTKKTEQRAPPDPTMLLIKFPQGGSLPSTNELKARFARFGPMDHSATRIYWNTYGCRMVYRHRAHAEAARRFVVGSSSLFGNVDVKCTLKDVGVDLEPQPPVKVPKEDYQPSGLEDRGPPSSMVPAAASSVQLKSILKKSGGEEAAGNGGRGRVKFILGGEESQTEKKNGASSFSKSHSTMDINSKNFQKAVLQSSSNPLPPLLPLPTSTTSVISSTAQFTRPPLPPPPPPPTNSMHYAPPPRLPPPPSLTYGGGGGGEMTTKTPPLAAEVDISHQMMSLLTKCNEVVTNVTNMFGYVPYRPL